MNSKQLYKITLTREQLMLISQCVEDISRYAAGDMGLQHTTETLIDDMGTVAHCDVKNNYYSLSKDENIQVQAKDVIDIPDGEFENMVERLFNEAKKNLL